MSDPEIMVVITLFIPETDTLSLSDRLAPLIREALKAGENSTQILIEPMELEDDT